jgi:hypothetical protein
MPGMGSFINNFIGAGGYFSAEFYCSAGALTPAEQNQFIYQTKPAEIPTLKPPGK